MDSDAIRWSCDTVRSDVASHSWSSWQSQTPHIDCRLVWVSLYHHQAPIYCFWPQKELYGQYEVIISCAAEVSIYCIHDHHQNFQPRTLHKQPSWAETPNIPWAKHIHGKHLKQHEHVQGKQTTNHIIVRVRDSIGRYYEVHAISTSIALLIPRFYQTMYLGRAAWTANAFLRHNTFASLSDLPWQTWSFFPSKYQLCINDVDLEVKLSMVV